MGGRAPDLDLVSGQAGGYVFPGAPIAAITPLVNEAEAAIRSATALATERKSSDDLEYAVRQLVEVAVRALSPGINDPHTAISVLDRLAAALCEIAPLHLRNGVYMRAGRPVLVVPSIEYAGLVDAMFHMIRQNAAGKPSVIIRIMEVLAGHQEASRVLRLTGNVRSSPLPSGY